MITLLRNAFLRNAAVATLLLWAPALQAQTATSFLNDVLGAAGTINTDVAANGNALKSLVIDFFILNNPSPDADGFVALTTLRQSAIEGAQDDATAAIGHAAALDSYINPANIQTWSAQIEGLGDAIVAKSAVLRSLILAGDATAAYPVALSIRADLTQQFNLSKQIAREAAYYKQAQQAFNVRILLEDYLGNPVTGSTGLYGYYAYNEYTGEYVYPDYIFADEFPDLRGSTYTFGAYPGYFDGASSRRVTLKASQEGPDGFIPVTLQYWSE
ncbi:MAG: hypothetical protein GC205_01180 [Bacteroidetes bacterium]|nr:hypothetical protein [Bacteroidota bacterium]